MSELLEAAQRFATQGRPVFPCQPRGKRPLTTNGLLDATTDQLIIERWWTRSSPDANVAIRTGAVSRLLVLDVDGDAGAESLRALEREYGALPRTASVVTPRGGQHIYFRHPGREVRNSAGLLGVGLDVRGDAGYVLAPPSVGANGRRYEVDEIAPLVAPPAWMLEQLCERESGRAAPVSDWLSITAGVEKGKRNSELARLVGHLLRRYVDVDLVSEIAVLVNQRCRPPLDQGEIDRIIESIAGRELRRRQRKART